MIRAVHSVAFVLSSLKFGGGERVALNLAYAFKKKGIKVDFVLMSKEGEFLKEAEENFNVVALECDRTWKLPSKLGAYLIKNRPDVVISSFWKLNLCSCLAKVFFPSVRLLLWEHSPPSKSSNSPTTLYAITATLLYQIATRVIAVSNGVREDISRITFGLNGKLQVIFNPILPPPSDLAGLGGNLNIKRIVWVGRLDAPKKPALMLEAFGQLPSSLNCILDFIGDGSLRSQLENRVIELGLQNKVYFRGFQHEPFRWMKDADLLVLSSDREGLCSVLIEALYCGLRVVSTSCGGGIDDVLQGGDYGTIIETGNTTALSNAIVRSLELPWSSALQRRGAERFRPEVVVEQFLRAMNAPSQDKHHGRN